MPTSSRSDMYASTKLYLCANCKQYPKITADYKCRYCYAAIHIWCHALPEELEGETALEGHGAIYLCKSCLAKLQGEVSPTEGTVPGTEPWPPRPVTRQPRPESPQPPNESDESTTTADSPHAQPDLLQLRAQQGLPPRATSRSVASSNQRSERESLPPTANDATDSRRTSPRFKSPVPYTKSTSKLSATSSSSKKGTLEESSASKRVTDAGSSRIGPKRCC